jgi:hypothetical protein
MSLSETPLETVCTGIFVFGADADQGSGVFLTPVRDPGWIKKIKIRIRDEHPGSYFRELRNNFLGYKY